MRIEQGRIDLKPKRSALLWLVLLVGLVFAMWEVPWTRIVHRGVGTRAFLQAAVHSEASGAGPGWPVVVEAEALEYAAWHLGQVSDERTGQDVYRTLGVMELASNNSVGAERWLQRRLERAPTDVLARYFLGEAYLRLGDTQAAIEHWGAAGAQQQLMGLAEGLAEREAWSEALAALELVSQLDAADLESRWLAAEIWREQGNPASALDLAQEIIAIAPESPIGYELSSRALFDAGQYERAIAFIEQALARDLARPHVTLRRLGDAHAALGQWPEAIEAYERAIRADPTRWGAYVLAGDVKCQLGLSEEARSYYEQAIALGFDKARIHRAIEYITEHGECPP